MTESEALDELWKLCDEMYLIADDAFGDQGVSKALKSLLLYLIVDAEACPHCIQGEAVWTCEHIMADGPVTRVH